MTASASFGSDGSTAVPSYAWKCAYGAVVAMVVTIPPGGAYFLYGGVFGPLSDAGALLVGLFLTPLVWTIYLLNKGASFNGVIFGVGAFTVIGICLGSLGLVVMNLVSLNPEIYEAPFLGIQFLGWILLGFWLFGVGRLGRRTGSISERTTWTGIIAGIAIAGVMATLIYSYSVGSFTQIFWLFAVVFVLGFLLWAFWIGGEFRARTHA